MRLFSAILLSTLAVVVLSKRVGPAPRLLNVQINRCPAATMYSNINEEENVDSSSFKKTIIQSDFEETLRFLANETGTVQFFVVGRGNFSVNIQSDENILKGLNGVHHVDSRQGAAVISLPFEVAKGVRETSINVTLTTRTIEKTTTIYASTKSLEPPRPPSLYTSMIFSPEEIETIENDQKNNTRPTDASVVIDTVTPPPEETPVVVLEGSSNNVTSSNSTQTYVDFPTVEEVLNGKWSNLASKTLRLDSINLNRLTANKTDRFVSKTNVYRVTIKKFEQGHIMFYVSGDGNKKVTAKSLAQPSHPAREMNVENGFAAFRYTDGTEYVDEDHILVRVENDLGEILYFYFVMTRVD